MSWRRTAPRPDAEEDPDPTRSEAPDPNRMEDDKDGGPTRTDATEPNRVLGLLLHVNFSEDPLQFDQNPRCKGSPDEKLELKI